MRGAGCTDAGTGEEPAENFGQMAIFAPPMLGGGLLAAQDAITRMTQVWGSWSPSGTLGVARGIPYVGVLASALYIPSAGEGSDRPPGQREFWHGDELRRKANTQMKATTRVRFFWRPDSQGNMQVYGVHTGEGTPYEGVRVALMKWVEENRRYEFTPAGSVDGPLITWTPETPAGAAGPSHTGHDVKPIDQATILVTPIPTGEDEYTTPAFPVPHERDLNDYILVFPADAGMEPIYVYLSKNPNVSIWTKTKQLEPVSNAYEHWVKHGDEFFDPVFNNAKEYVDATHDFVTNPPESTLTKVRKNGDILFYHPGSNTFAIKNKDGVPKTMFKPSDRMGYWERQQ